MKAQHTPGPFEINGEGAVIATVGGKRAGFQLITAPVTSALEPLSPEEVEANAHLMKASPLLLQALEMVRDADDDCRRDGMPTIPVQPRAVIDAAIAAAKGGAR